MLSLQSVYTGAVGVATAGTFGLADMAGKHVKLPEGNCPTEVGLSLA